MGNNELCKLWHENTNLKDQIHGSSPYPTSYSSITPLISDRPNEVICPYLGGPYESEHCDLWCENELLKFGSVCYQTTSTQSTTTKEKCPYLGYTNENVLCDLWEEIEDELDKQSSATDSTPAGATNTGSSSQGTTKAPTTIPYSDCPHKNLDDGVLACQLWCQLQELQTGVECVDRPPCPYENYTSPHNNELCKLWHENTNLKDQIHGSSPYPTAYSSVTPLISDGPDEVICPYLGRPYESEHCDLWYENEFLKFGSVCHQTTSTQSTTTKEKCPYLGYTNEDVLCDLWEEIEDELDKQSSPTDSTPTGATNTGSSSQGTTEAPSTIPYSDCPHKNLNDGVLACQLWCQLQELQTGVECVDRLPCPYENYTSPHNNELCKLWHENTNLKDQIHGSSPYPTSYSSITPLISDGPN